MVEGPGEGERRTDNWRLRSEHGACFRQRRRAASVEMDVEMVRYCLDILGVPSTKTGTTDAVHLNEPCNDTADGSSNTRESPADGQCDLTPVGMRKTLKLRLKRFAPAVLPAYATNGRLENAAILILDFGFPSFFWIRRLPRKRTENARSVVVWGTAPKRGAVKWGNAATVNATRSGQSSYTFAPATARQLRTGPSGPRKSISILGIGMRFKTRVITTRSRLHTRRMACMRLKSQPSGGA